MAYESGVPCEFTRAPKRNGLASPSVSIDWSDALAQSLPVDSAATFLDWLQRFVQPLVGYQMVACGNAILTEQGLRVHRLVCRKFPDEVLDRMRDTDGVVTLPHADWRSDARAFSPLRARGFTAAIKQVDAGPAPYVSVHAQRDSTSRTGTFFLFGSDGECASPQRAALQMIGPTMHALLIRVMDADPRTLIAQEPPVVLSRREMIVLHWLVAGRTTPEIATQTGRSVHTIRNQLRAIMQKFGANNRMEVAFLAVSMGVVQAHGHTGRTRVVAAQRRAIYRAGAPWLPPSS